VTCKYIERWYEDVQRVVEILEYIEVVHQGQEKEEQGIRMMGKSSLNRMKWSAEYWVICLETHTKKYKSNGPNARRTGIKLIKK
jgi:hypothetical protein